MNETENKETLAVTKVSRVPPTTQVAGRHPSPQVKHTASQEATDNAAIKKIIEGPVPVDSPFTVSVEASMDTGRIHVVVSPKEQKPDTQWVSGAALRFLYSGKV